jgi:sigma-B regulation protein RsbU (phosphoserine phosphatase)
MEREIEDLRDDMIVRMPADQSQHMTCMEIWGGNQTVDNAVVMSGLDAWVYSKPFGQSEGGGDVYYVSSCATGRITRLLLADVSGHGKMVAEIAGALRKLMQKYVNFIDQSAFVRSMNQQFAELSTAGVFATAIVSTFFAPTKELTLCIAGHPTPLLYLSGEKRWCLVSQCNTDGEVAGNIPLGIADTEDWSQFGVRLDVGDLVLCYTDSLMEARGGDGEMLGMDGLVAIANELEISDPKLVTGKLLAAIAERHAENLRLDDVTVLLFRPNGMGAAVALKDKIFGPMRVFAGVVRSIFPGGAPAPWPEMSVANIGGMLLRPLNRVLGRRRAS